jgi:hypothetical protein
MHAEFGWINWQEETICERQAYSGDNIEMHDQGIWCFSEHGNESLESTEGEEFHDWLSGFYLLKDLAPWISLFIWLDNTRLDKLKAKVLCISKYQVVKFYGGVVVELHVSTVWFSVSHFETLITSYTQKLAPPALCDRNFKRP